MPSVRAFTTEAACLAATEGRRPIGRKSSVQRDHAALHLPGKAQTTLQVLGVDVGNRPKFGVVGQLHGARLIVEGCSPSGPVRQIEGFCGGRISGSS
ncbi:bsr8213 [Bradyrhizobium diazoefficiens USDA 110]|uniref:Bsr8213 protein n=1 Tax=Bradyrhizobium diazoefficiens (strain JCM 10833 / BCRC 13528 / IAM 13628 / NBRC 14792 / USDA 110) TaxID=224911 RepID=Q89BE2_BRADU|nr:bsr8213 [Bradyrhizobium diazoefficiens USDA 110]